MTDSDIIKRLLINDMYYVIEKKTSGGMIIIYFGGKDIQCIEIGFYLSDDYGKLYTIVHDTCCNKTNNLSNGLEGTVMLANVAFNYIRRYYPTIRILYLDDDNNKYCKLNELENVSLIHYYVAFYGQTWYQRQFFAEPDITNLRYYNECINLLTNDDYFRSTVKSNSLMSKKIVRILETSTNLSNFFTRIKDEYRDSIKLCKKCQPLIEDFMDIYVYRGRVSSLRSKWSIIIDRIPNINFDTIIDVTNTTNYSKQPNENFDFKKFECVAKQRGSGIKKNLKVYLRTFDKNGFPNDIYLGTADNYKAYRDKLCREKDSCIGLIVYK